MVGLIMLNWACFVNIDMVCWFSIFDLLVLILAWCVNIGMVCSYRMFDISNFKTIIVCQYRDSMLTLNDCLYLIIFVLYVNIGILCWYIMFHTSNIDFDNDMSI